MSDGNYDSEQDAWDDRSDVNRRAYLLSKRGRVSMLDCIGARLEELRNEQRSKRPVDGESRE